MSHIRKDWEAITETFDTGDYIDENVAIISAKKRGSIDEIIDEAEKRSDVIRDQQTERVLLRNEKIGGTRISTYLSRKI